MDHDAMGTHVTKLLTWKKDIESTFAEFKAWVAEQKATGSTVNDGLTRRVDDLESKISSLPGLVQSAVAPFQAKIDDMQSKLLPAEQVDALGFMLTWFQDNQPALEVLLSMGDDTSAGEAPIQEGDAVTIEKVGTIDPAAAPAASAGSEATNTATSAETAPAGT